MFKRIWLVAIVVLWIKRFWIVR